LSCFAVAQYLGGSGFIAAFSGGLLVAFMDTHLSREVKDEFLLASEGTGDTLALITWVIFGSAVVGQAVGNFSWMILLYSVLSLTVIRMLPVFLCLAGSGIDTEGKLFIGWFGPRGLASIVFVVMVVNSGLPDSGVLAMTVVCTIMLSILVHGITANSWARAYGKRRQQTP
jgi:NhaP-type Na+/H+ or K+/H+ antiporter